MTGRVVVVVIVASFAGGGCEGRGGASAGGARPSDSARAHDAVQDRSVFPVEWSPALGLRSLADVQRREAEGSPDTLELAIFDGRCSPGRAGAEPTCNDVDTVVTATCREFRRRVAQGYAALNTLRLATVQSAGLRCAALAQLRRARAARHSAVRSVVLSERVVELLPPVVGVTVTPGDSARAARDSRRELSWVRSEPDMSVEVERDSVEGPRLRVQTASGSTLLAVLGRGDFTGDGWDDLMLRVTNRPRGGALVTDDVVVLTRRDSTALLTVIPLPET